VTGRKRGEEELGEQRRGVEFAAAHWQSEEGEVQSSGAKALEKNWRDFFEDAELGLRELSRKGSQARGKKIRSDGGNNADVDGAGDGVLLFDDLAFGGFEFAQDGASVRKKGLTQLREAYAAAEAVEKTRTEFVLELEDLLGKRRLRDVRLFRGTGERKSFSDGAEVAELVEFHGPVFCVEAAGTILVSSEPRTFGYRLCLSIVSELGIGTMVGKPLPFEAADIV
jgi:hypothetical protein